MPFETAPEPPHIDILRACFKRFPRLTTAFEHLKKLGKPPSIIDISCPSSQLQSACDIIGSIAYHETVNPIMTTNLIRTRWESHLARWVVYLLRVALKIHEYSSTPSWRDTFLCIAVSVPYMLEFTSANLAFVKRCSPELQFLLGQVWLILLDREDDLWYSFGTAFVKVAHSPAFSPSSALTIPTRDPKTSNTDEVRIDGYGKRILWHIQRRIGRLSTMEPSELSALRALEFAAERLPKCFPGAEEDHLTPDHIPYTISTMTQVLTTLLCKRKSLRLEPIGSASHQYCHELVVNPLELVLRLLTNPVAIKMAVEAGILQALFFAEECYYLMDETDSVKPTHKFADAATKVVNRIAIYLIYSSVLRPFVRTSRKLAQSREEVQARISRSPALNAAWNNIFDKALALNRARCAIKITLNLCHNEAVSHTQILISEEIFNFLPCYLVSNLDPFA
ncbi:hypothetical protein V5O48_009340 [Marasmius crinis-equi]|uniref:Uncharacterized protein n=1 Tax=Marasmius crinis-equi TaxID=585013 RepID=A0ABR3FBK6_9AGAR